MGVEELGGILRIFVDVFLGRLRSLSCISWRFVWLLRKWLGVGTFLKLKDYKLSWNGQNFPDVFSLRSTITLFNIFKLQRYFFKPTQTQTQRHNNQSSIEWTKTHHKRNQLPVFNNYSLINDSSLSILKPSLWIYHSYQKLKLIGKKIFYYLNYIP